MSDNTAETTEVEATEPKTEFVSPTLMIVAITNKIAPDFSDSKKRLKVSVNIREFGIGSRN